MQVLPLIEELTEAGCSAQGVKAKDGYVERLCAYSRTVAHFPTAVKEFPWRNGYFADLSQEAREGGQEDPCPIHSQMLGDIEM